MTIKTSAVLLAIFFVACSASTDRSVEAGKDTSIKNFNNLTLEMSLKPFKKNDKAYIRSVVRNVFKQWEALSGYADTISILLWTSDGSEILDYRGDMSQPLEWARYVGNPNASHPVNSGTRELTLHDRAYTYVDHPPKFTYGDLKFIVQTLKKEGQALTGKPIRVGETFDPGPEFAKSSFKYERHTEICMANTMGTKSFVCCYATLNEDKAPYAAYPKGIPDGTPLGEFLGKQSQAFLTDMGFDYLWLSNGFGFGMETWNTVGAIFDGEQFHAEKMPDVQGRILHFWTSFREACPHIRIETRGTNLSAGIDLARDGVDLRSIYKGGYNLLPPPNSPWAALDGDFGLELTGYMSRISTIPDNRYLFRFYTHDPWWANSPWLDRYGREAHDIYLPMSVGRVNEKGEVTLPTHVSFLSIDNAYGEMPDQVPEEVIPHMLQARRIAPDEPGPLVWIYPFEEYHDLAFNEPDRLPEVFYGDWFIRQALNEGFPLNTVVSTTNFVHLMDSKSDLFDASILVTIVPKAGSKMEKHLMDFVCNGGRLMVYGPVSHAGKEFLDFMNVRLAPPLDGIFALERVKRLDLAPSLSRQIRHNKTVSGGGVETICNMPDSETEVLLRFVQAGKGRDVVLLRKANSWKGGMLAYVRGTNSASYMGGMLLTPDDANSFFLGGSLMRYALSVFGYDIRYNKANVASKSPINCISRHDNGYYFAGYVPDQTVEQLMKFQQGAPLFTGMETELKNGYASYRMSKSWSKECRVFVEQESGIVSCREMAPVEFRINRKIGIQGLKNATVRIYPGRDETNYKAMPHNNHFPAIEEILPSVKGCEYRGEYYEYKNVSGELVITW